MQLPKIALTSCVLLLGLSACKPTPTAAKLSTILVEDPLLARASFDLGCPAADIQQVYVDERSRGARGCGKQARYVRSCTRCQWLRDGEVAQVP